MMTLTRPEFLKKLIRAILVAFLAFLALSLGSKAVSEKIAVPVLAMEFAMEKLIVTII